MKDYPTANLFNVHENLIEALLELQAYADVQALLVKYDGQSCDYLLMLFIRETRMCGAMPSMMFAHCYMKVPEFQHWQPERVILLVVMC